MVQSKRSSAVRVSIEKLTINRDQIKAAGTKGFSQSAQLEHLYTIGIAIVERLEKIQRALNK